MNALREIKKVKNGKVEIDIPKSFDGKDVEVIVLINSDTLTKNHKESKRKKNGRSLAGIFKKYTNPSLIEREKEAWGMAVKEKYGLH